jgi:hypothetical protein
MTNSAISGSGYASASVQPVKTRLDSDGAKTAVEAVARNTGASRGAAAAAIAAGAPPRGQNVDIVV